MADSLLNRKNYIVPTMNITTTNGKILNKSRIEGIKSMSIINANKTANKI